METKKRKTTKKKRSESSEKAKKQDNRVLFPVWFSNEVRKGTLKPWQEAEIRAFFKDKGLTEKEEPDKYKECVKLY